MKEIYSPGNASLLLLKKIVVFLLVCYSPSISAQVKWTNTGSSTEWYDAGNWTVNTTPVAWLSSDIAEFDNTGTAITAGIDMNQGPLSIGAVFISSLRSRALTIGNSSATAGALTLNGATLLGVPNVILCANQSSSGAININIQDNETGSGRIMDVILGNAIENIVYMPGYSTLEINSAIKGNNKSLTLKGGTEAAHLNLSGANTYSGLTTLSARMGMLELKRPGGGTLPAGNNVAVSDGTLKISTNQTLHDVTLAPISGGGLNVVAGATLTVSGNLTKVSGFTIGAIAYQPGATLTYGYGGFGTGAEFPIAAGPTNVVIESSTNLLLTGARTITGALTIDGGFVTLGNYDLTVGALNVTNNGRIVINGTGKLIISSVGNTAVTIPLSTTGATINPLTISNGQGLSYTVGLLDGISPSIVNYSNAIDKTWTIKPSATPAAPVNVSFGFNYGDGNAEFNYANPLELGQYTGTAWNVIQSGITEVQPVATVISTMVGNVENKFILSNMGAVLASESAIDFNVIRQNDKGHLTWRIENTATLKQLTVERSANGKDFAMLAPVGTTSVYYDDAALLPSLNYYRLKLTDINGKVTYTTIVSLRNTAAGFDMVSISPTLVQSSATLHVSAAQKSKMDVLILDASGTQVQKLQYTLNAGSNLLPLNVAQLKSGVYFVSGQTADGSTRTLRFVKN